ncbi:MAG TPA: ATP-dependent RNA helicase HrpA [Stackebrandtia sp.]|uniref:ATP-dependent RNA helicase HrpA n=1 Tax=Stackebrandtia sp. TaxID=2023065 RepID=UPI002D75D4A1|nr:ATP-dependent RNA helicase HrpA [Stackebrandtia sp.]HZE40055.1 ATP-dependent RNA helicase HrpA [Stackebrandtia sp.]
MATDHAPSPSRLRTRVRGLMLREQGRFLRRIESASKRDDADKLLGRLDADIAAAEQRVARRRDERPEVQYPSELPVSQRKDDIAAAIRDHQVVIVAGETGSGKTTQLPKICMELGRGVQGMIGHTQPRRIAARTVAERIAEELDSPLGEAVGWKIRFTDKVSERTYCKVMTDGILLAEIQNDRALRAYDTLIIDEAHERSLNIDFLLGYLKQLLPRRPDLKVIITSATIDPERFSRHFADAPIVEVSGRTYPVEVRYRPLVDDSDPDSDNVRDAIEAIVDASRELMASGPGDILVFLSGEREIRDTAEALTKEDFRHTEILPLYARLSSAEQHRVFTRHTGRRIVLATNVAETSLTVPGIKYVIDPGTARISRYSLRTKVQRLPIEPISQASANQRKGRCGRTSDGICVRLYSEEDFDSRPEFTDAEILRTNLASVILQMTAAGLGRIEEFPFIDPPDRRNIRDGVWLLNELGAIDDDADPRKRLTNRGRQLARLPVDPRLGRMVLQAHNDGCLHEVMVIASALSIQDPRERPADRQQQADAKHSRFADPSSDFLAFIKLWNYIKDEQKARSGSAFRRMCKAEYLHYMRIREWQDIYGQLRLVLKGLGYTPNVTAEAVDPQRVHTALLSGLLSHIGLKDPETRDYLGARGARFAIFPGSALFKKQPKWVASAELVETSRLWARVNAKIEPEWIEPLAGHLVKRDYSEPHWEKKPAAVMATEKVTLYGIPIVAARKVNYGRVEPEVARDIFIRSALVEGDWDTHHRFFAANRELLDSVEDLENRARRRDILVDEDTLYDFYDGRIPPEVVSGRHFDSWWKGARREAPNLLDFSADMLINAEAEAVNQADYPDRWETGGAQLPLTYQFEPGAAADGVTVHIPLALVAQLDPDAFTWQVPGLRLELVTALVKSLPKAIRRHFSPAPDHALAALHTMTPGQGGSLVDALAVQLHAMRHVTIPRDAWDHSRVPGHLLPTFAVEDEDGTVLAEGKDLAALQRQLRPKAAEVIAESVPDVERAGLTDWDFDQLPRVEEQTRRGGYTVRAYPSLVDEGDSVAIRLKESEATQQLTMWHGTRRLLLLTLPSPLKRLLSTLPSRTKLALGANPYDSVPALLDDCVRTACDKLMIDAGGPAWDREGFDKLRDAVRQSLADTTAEVVETVAEVLTTGRRVDKLLSGRFPFAHLNAIADMKRQREALVFKGFVSATGWWRLKDLVRYLEAVERRATKLPTAGDADGVWMARAQAVEAAFHELATSLPAAAASPQGQEVRWMCEELRVSYFAQDLGTRYAVSDKRIIKAINALR